MRRALCVAVLLMVGVISEAAAAAPTGPTVTASGDLALHARRDGRDLCLVLVASGDAGVADCARAPADPLGSVEVGRDSPSAPYAAAVDERVTSVGLQRPGGETRYDTVTAPGFTARFVLVPAAGKLSLVRFYGADGALLGASDATVVDPPKRNRAVVRIDARTRLFAFTEDRLSPTPLQRDRIIARACLSKSRDGFPVCDADLSVLNLEADDSCDTRRHFVLGLSAPDVELVELQLGDGRRVRTVTRSLPAAYAGRRAFGVRLPPGVAVRTARALDGDRRLISRVEFQLAPSIGCPSVQSDSFGDFPYGRARADTAPAVVGTAGRRRLLAADKGDRLCVGVDRLYEYDCEIPPVTGTAPSLTNRGGVLSGVLAGEVAGLQARFQDGSIEAVPLTDGPAYTGQYAGTVKFAAYRIPRGRQLDRVVAFDATGRRLGSASAYPVTQGRFLRAVVGTRRFGAVIQTDSFDGKGVCLAASTNGFATGLVVCESGLNSQPTVVVGCRPRGTVILGPGRPEAIRLTAGATVRGTYVRRLDAWAALLPGRAGVVSIDGKPLRILPASEQCGYAGTA